MQKRLLHTLLTVSATAVFPVFSFAVGKSDSTDVKDIEEVVIVSAPKETGKLKERPGAVSIISKDDMTRHGITSLKGISGIVPNTFIPDYGSRLTSAIYIRGIGSRINTPAIGLYVDNIPYSDKSAFDFRFYDIERIDILRGPQGTLYGRNSMGGLIRIHTLSPFSYQGFTLNLGMATADAHRNISLTHYRRISQCFAFSAGGYYDGSNGFYQNTMLHQRQDKMNSGGGRMRAILRTGKLKADFTASYDYSHEGGYPYCYAGQAEGEETRPSLLGKISANEESSYRRNMANAGVSVEYRTGDISLNYTGSWQRLQDRLFMDQDFISDNIYTLEQKQLLHTVSQELTINKHKDSFWQWLNGVSALKQWLKTSGPVDFKTGGIDFLQYNINSYMPDLSGKGISSMAVAINDPHITMGGNFRTPASNLAVFHQSTLNFTKAVSLAIGVRLDYEHNSLSYNSAGTVNYNFSMTGGRMPLNLTDLKTTPSLHGKLSDDCLEVLPKLAFKIHPCDNFMLYASAAKGHRPGGYNVQMFSDLLQESMRGDMTQNIKDATNNALDKYAQMGMPSAVISNIKACLEEMPASATPNVNNAVAFKPEFSWNYEIGSRLKFLDGTLQTEVALFLATIRDQQIVRFAPNGLGRAMANAGRSRSYGTEITVRYAPSARLTVWTSYGYTHATFTKHDAGKGKDYTGNRVPFIPQNTLSAGTDYTVWIPKRGVLKSLTAGADIKACGRIYWTENNDASQPLYTVIGSHLLFDFGICKINLWGKNLTDKHYHSFCFESMNRRYVQKGKPLQLGIDFKLRF